MKKKVSCMLALAIAILLFSQPALAAETPVFSDSPIYIEDIDGAVHGIYDSNDGITTYADSILQSYSLTLGKSGANLYISAYTEGTLETKKSGFTYVRLEQLVNGVWQTYASWNDYYSSSVSCSFGKLVSAPPGNYRAVCEHYVQKPFLGIFSSSEKKYNTTPLFQFT